VKIIYSHNKSGVEANRWADELKAIGDGTTEIIPFNHGGYFPLQVLAEASGLDRLYRTRDSRLLRLQDDLLLLIEQSGADALLVTNYPPYHPDFLRKVPIYRSLYSTDDPDATYRRTIPYLHAYDHVFFCDPAYSPELDMKTKMTEAGMRNADWLPLGVFDFEFDPQKSEEALFEQTRDIDVVYIGACFLQKLPVLAEVKRAFGSRFVMRGYFSAKQNVYFNVRHRAGFWVKPVSMTERVQLYQRAKIGFNIHWDEYGLGNQRLYHLPANGAMQISDCAADLGRVFKVGEEVISYRTTAELIDLLKMFLANDTERLRIARNAHRRVMAEYRIAQVTLAAAARMSAAMKASEPGV
jgi:spore maturation protein CgeB